MKWDIFEHVKELLCLNENSLVDVNVCHNQYFDYQIRMQSKILSTLSLIKRTLTSPGRSEHSWSDF